MLNSGSYWYFPSSRADTYNECASKRVRISWLWHYIHYQSIPLYTISWPELFSRHTLYLKPVDGCLFGIFLMASRRRRREGRATDWSSQINDFYTRPFIWFPTVFHCWSPLKNGKELWNGLYTNHKLFFNIVQTSWEEILRRWRYRS